MSYSEWTRTSSAYQAYADATAHCVAVFTVPRLEAALEAAEQAERAAIAQHWDTPSYKASCEAAREVRITAVRALNAAKTAAMTTTQLAAREARRQAARTEHATAERVAQEAEIAAQHRAMIEAEHGPLATESQIRYIVDLERRRAISGDGGGFVTGSPISTSEQLACMTRQKASEYITSLKGDY